MAWKRQLLEGEPDLKSYDLIIVSFSGGKDSAACFFHLLDLGVSPNDMELWHQDVDGLDGEFFDWPVTRSYVRAFAEAFGVDHYFQWRHGGFKREMTRLDRPTAPTSFEMPGGELKTIGGAGPDNTRMQFPQVTANLAQRWCSAYLKIDVCTAALRNDPRFKSSRVLLVTGERGEESSARSKYPQFEVHKSANKGRTVHQWRPILHWKEQRVWDIMRENRVVPHPAYRIGLGRVSCMSCIFGGDDQWHTVRQLNPTLFTEISRYEQEFGEHHGLGRPKTIHRTKTVEERADKGKSMIPKDTPKSVITQAMSKSYTGGIILPDGQEWVLPSGAFKETSGPT
jgi:3'-phosphoadenosine 5'-phosphosulfate sulfotransferase (PAPS reductase)/FAD synthetase